MQGAIYPFSKDWHSRASVRSAVTAGEIPASALAAAEGDEAGRFFPEKLVALGSHPLVREKGPEIRTQVHVRHLYRYLHFTRALEIATVNPVAQAIAIPSPESAFLNRLPADEREALAREAYRLYCDEAFHAVEANELIAAIEEHTGIRAPRMQTETPYYLDALRAERESAPTPELGFLTLFGFVCVSETLVSQTLSQLPGDAGVADPVRRFAREHGRDEAWHCHYFSEVFQRVWSTLTEEERLYLGTRLPRMVRIFLRPDVLAIDRELEGYGFNSADRIQIVGDVQEIGLRADNLRSAAAGSLRLFRKAGVLDSPAIAAAFEKEGL